MKKGTKKEDRFSLLLLDMVLGRIKRMRRKKHYKPMWDIEIYHPIEGRLYDVEIIEEIDKTKINT